MDFATRVFAIIVLVSFLSFCEGKRQLSVEKKFYRNREYFKIENFTSSGETELRDDVTFPNAIVTVQESEIVRIPEKFFKVFPEAESVTISKIGLQLVNQEVFQNARKLTVLNLSQNNIGNLAEFVFVHLGKLEKLSLAKNALTGIHPSVFGGLNSLKVLDLTGNKITRLTSETFVSLDQLEDLSLDNNKFQTLPADIFAYNKKLNSLMLKNCGLEGVNREIFKHLTDLERIDLSENKIEALSSDLFEENLKLEQFFCNKCSLKDIGMTFFTKFHHLTTVGISHNSLDRVFLPKITTVYAFRSNIKELHMNSTVEFLWVSNNQLKSIELPNLELTRTIDAENNQISDIEFMKTARSIRVLDLSGNPLNPQKLRREVFADMAYLDFLDLSNTQLTDFVHQDVFTGLTSLTFLNISDNHISNLDVELFKPLKKLESLHIYGNDLTTFDCEGLKNVGIKATVKHCI